MFYLDKKEYLMSPKVQKRLFMAAAVVVLLLILPLPHETMQLPVVLRAATTVQINAPADATVGAVAVREGEAVMPGRVLARLSSRAVDGRIEVLKARKAGYEGEANLGREDASAEDATASESRAIAAASALKASQSLRDALDLRAPVAGTVLTPRPEDLVGSSFPAGAPLFTLADTRTMRAEIPVTERLIQSMRVGEPVSMRVQGEPFHTYRSRIAAIAPAAQTLPAIANATNQSLLPGEIPERFVAVVEVDNSDGSLKPGMTAEAKLLGRRIPYAVQWWRVFYHWLRRIIW
jgi:multidrug resistance efflux pump